MTFDVFTLEFVFIGELFRVIIVNGVDLFLVSLYFFRVHD